MFKNVASQKFIVFAFDSTTNLPKTGDAANITAYVSKDYGAVTVLGDTTATEMDATNAKGYYLFDAAQAETNADALAVTGKSATANIVVIGAPAVIFTLPPSFTAFTAPLTGAQVATAVWTDTTAGDFTTALSVGKSVMNGVALGTGLTVNDITTKTGYALTAAYDIAKGNVALTESYAALHGVPTLSQILFEIRGLLAEPSVASTTLTIKKIDGSTSAETFTLNSATAPTSVTRAT